MAEDLYIKNLMRKVRTGDETQTTKLNGEKRKKLNEQQQPESVIEIIKEARAYNIIGNKKRPIKVDRKNEEILKMLNPVLGVDVSRFINLLLAQYIEDHPELLTEIKKSINRLCTGQTLSNTQASCSSSITP